MNSQAQVLHDVSLALAKEAKVPQETVLLKLMKVPRYRDIMGALSISEVCEVLNMTPTRMELVYKHTLRKLKHPSFMKMSRIIKDDLSDYCNGVRHLT